MCLSCSYLPMTWAGPSWRQRHPKGTLWGRLSDSVLLLLSCYFVIGRIYYIFLLAVDLAPRDLFLLFLFTSTLQLRRINSRTRKQ